MSLASIVDRCDNFRLKPAAAAGLAEFRLAPSAPHVLGLLCPDVVAALHLANPDPPVWDIRPPPSAAGRTLVTFASAAATPAARSCALAALTAGWRDSGRFAAVLAPRLWRDELYPVYADPLAPHAGAGAEPEFVVERAACALFGLVTYGVHMTMHTHDTRVWVPTRARTKQTWPLCLDNTVAGGIPHGLSPFEALVKECAEEAGLDSALVAAHAKPCGAVSYIFRSPHGYVQPEVQFVYDLPIPPGREWLFVPRPSDGEVQSFQLADLEDVVAKMHEGLFKPNSALVLVDFLIRHGKITPENEPRYLDIVTRLHGRFGYEGV